MNKTILFFVFLLLFAVIFGGVYYLGVMTNLGTQITAFNNETLAYIPIEYKGLFVLLILILLWMFIDKHKPTI